VGEEGGKYRLAATSHSTNLFAGWFFLLVLFFICVVCAYGFLFICEFVLVISFIFCTAAQTIDQQDANANDPEKRGIELAKLKEWIK
jgi:hypothetical protein